MYTTSDIRRGLVDSEAELEALTDIVDALDTAHERAKKARLTDLAGKLATLLAEVQKSRETLDDAMANDVQELMVLTGSCRW